MQAKASLWQIQWTLIKTGLSSESFVATPFFFPVVTEAPSVAKPLRFDRLKLHCCNSSLTRDVRASALALANSSRHWQKCNLHARSNRAYKLYECKHLGLHRDVSDFIHHEPITLDLLCTAHYFFLDGFSQDEEDFSDRSFRPVIEVFEMVHSKGILGKLNQVTKLSVCNVRLCQKVSKQPKKPSPRRPWQFLFVQQLLYGIQTCTVKALDWLLYDVGQNHDVP